MTLPTTAVTTSAITSDLRFSRFASIVINAYWIWQHPEVKPHGLTFGLEVSPDTGRYDLEPLERQSIRTHDTLVHMCLIGAAMVGMPHVESVRLDASSQYGVTLSEIEDIIIGFDHGDDGSPLRSDDGDARAFGIAVRTALFGATPPKYVATAGDAATALVV